MLKKIIVESLRDDVGDKQAVGMEKMVCDCPWEE